MATLRCVSFPFAFSHRQPTCRDGGRAPPCLGPNFRWGPLGARRLVPPNRILRSGALLGTMTQSRPPEKDYKDGGSSDILAMHPIRSWRWAFVGSVHRL